MRLCHPHDCRNATPPNPPFLRGGTMRDETRRKSELRQPQVFITPVLAAAVALLAASAMLLAAGTRARADEPERKREAAKVSATDRDGRDAKTAESPAGGASIGLNRPTELEGRLTLPRREDTMRTVQTVALFGLISLAPIALLMVTAFVRINIVLILLRQALGSPQVPGNQVLTALALLLTVLVMRPHAERVYQDAVRPYAAGEVSAADAWAAGSKPIKAFMVEQIVLTKHQDYLESLYDYAVPPSPGRVDPGQIGAEDFPLHVVAPAYLLSELTTALLMGFYIYLPFLVIDLVVSSVLAATGLFMLPPSLVATPVKLIVFVLADGWLLIATMLLSSFSN
jgi:flagellar biosynthesis protein FliP